MKTYGILCFVLAFAMFVSPIAALDLHKFSSENVKSAFSALKEGKKGTEETVTEPPRTDVSVLQTAGGNVVTVEEAEYVLGCVAGEMSPDCNEEALKAQAVAAYTNLKRLQREKKDADRPDITDDTGKHQAYWDEAKRREKWGDKFDSYTEKLQKAIESVLGEILTYNGKPITATFFSLSTGKTASAKSIWGGDIPYLQSVISAGDALAPDLVTEQSFSVDDLRNLLKKDKEIILPTDGTDFITEIKTDDSGVVLFVTVGGKTMRGNAFRSLLGLKSPAFQLKVEEDAFVFTVSGNGHLVGMSQYGADCMARQGSSYKEILAHYYPGTTLSH